MPKHNHKLWRLLADACALNQSTYASPDEVLAKISAMRTIIIDLDDKKSGNANLFPVEVMTHVSGVNGVVSISPNDICYVPSDLSRRSPQYITEFKPSGLDLFPRRLARPELISDVAIDDLLTIVSDFLISSFVFYIEFEKMHYGIASEIPLTAQTSPFRVLSVKARTMVSDENMQTMESTQESTIPRSIDRNSIASPGAMSPATSLSSRSRFSSLIRFGLSNLSEFEALLMQGLRVVLHISSNRRIFRLMNYSPSLKSIVFLKQIDNDHFADPGERVSLSQISSVYCLGVSNGVMQDSCSQLYGQSTLSVRGTSTDDDFKLSVNRILSLSLTVPLRCFESYFALESDSKFLNIEIQPISRLARQELYSAVKVAVGVAVFIQNSLKRIAHSSRRKSLETFFPTGTAIRIQDTEEYCLFKESQLEENSKSEDEDDDFLESGKKKPIVVYKKPPPKVVREEIL